MYRKFFWLHTEGDNSCFLEQAAHHFEDIVCDSEGKFRAEDGSALADTYGRIAVLLPAKKELCCQCEGLTGNPLESDMWQDVYEATCDGLSEEACEYGGGYRYERCPACNGTGIQVVPDLDRMTDIQKAMWEYSQQWEMDMARMDAEDARTRWYESGCPC